LQNKLNGILATNGFPENKTKMSVYRALAEALMEAVLSKQLVKGEKLPPSRVLANDIGVSRSTVIKAYEILCIEKYVKSVQGSGYYVEDVQRKKIKHRLLSISTNGSRPEISERGKRFRKYVNLMNRTSGGGTAFRPGLPPLDIFPVRQWQSLTNRYWRDVTYSEMSYGDPQGLLSLRKNITDYLRIYRNIHCHYDQVIIVTGSMHSISIIGDLLIDADDQIIVENPAYANAIAIFKSLKAKLLAASIDDEGIDIKGVPLSKVQDPKFIYTTPSNQYPSGIKTSLDRRLEVLEWAQKHNCLIVEDDYDHEFSNWEEPITSIFGLDKSESVIYLGTFNKLLHPSVRLGYIIVPPYLVNDIRASLEQTLRFVPPMNQKIMSTFIEKGYLSTHLRKVVEVSNTRRSYFIDQFNRELGAIMSLRPLTQGLHVIADLPKSIVDNELAKFLTENGITVFPLSKYVVKGNMGNGLVMGFSSVDKASIKSKIREMGALCRQFIKHQQSQ
jgi:GntR family transcriptional regulator/MocR family aminotransferase